MPETFPHQKMITVHKPRYTRDFLQVSDAEWQTVSRDKEHLGRTALQLYLYLADNADEYTFALSQQAVENAVGIGRTSYDKYFKRLEDAGYIVWRQGNSYDFYTSPRPANERTQHYKDKEEKDILNLDDDFSTEQEEIATTRNELPLREQSVSQDGQNLPPSNREIDNKYGTDNGETDNIDSGMLRIPTPAAEAACASRANNEKVWYISAQALQEQHDKIRAEMKRRHR